MRGNRIKIYMTRNNITGGDFMSNDKEKSLAKQLQEKLVSKRKNACLILSDEQIANADSFSYNFV